MIRKNVRRRRDRPRDAFGDGWHGRGDSLEAGGGKGSEVLHERHDGRCKSGESTAHHSACAAATSLVFSPSALSATMALDSAPSQDESVGTSKQAFSLENILSDAHENIEHLADASNEASATASGWDEEAGQEHVALGFCVECEGASGR